MLKLVVEELQEAHRFRSESDIDVDSVFMKLPQELRSQVLGTMSTEVDDESEITDFVSYDDIRH